tara:strand:- start:4843 stop:5460 length:618 start_codon:yes stop_codon:yes gene_type:complete
MAFPTTNAVNELPAINQILASCGQAPVTTLDSTNPDVAIAYDTLLEVSREVQAEGWSFNKESHYEITPDTNDEIVIPSNILQLDLSNNGTNGSKDAIRRNGKLYDKQNHTFKWTNGAVDCEVLWLFDWVDLPQPIKDYITSRASTLVSSRIVGDKTQYEMLQQKEAYMRAMAVEYECNQGDYSYFGKPNDSEPYVSYEPYKALIR